MNYFKYIAAFLIGALSIYLALSFISGSLSWVFVRASETQRGDQIVYIFGKILVLAGGWYGCLIYHFEAKK